MKTSETLKLVIAVLVSIALHCETSAQNLPAVVAVQDLPAATVLNESHLLLVQLPLDAIPLGSFAETQQLIGQKLKIAVGAKEPILDVALAEKAADSSPSLPGETMPDANQETRIIGIPVSISTRYEIGETVRLVDTDRNQRKTIADNLKVFHIGEPDTIDGEDNKKVFIRIVSVLAPIRTAETIVNSIDSGKGIYVLEKANPNSRSSQSTTTNSNRAPLTNQSGFEPQAREVTGIQAPDPERYPAQLRKLARTLEGQAAELEDQGNFRQADLIREACQKLREAARAN